MGCFRESARKIGMDLDVLAGDVQPGMSPACHMADKSFELPPCLEEDYIESLLKICRREGVSMIVPTIDTELEMLSSERMRFEKSGVRVCVPPNESVAVCRDKLLTALSLEACGIDIPLSAGLSEKHNWQKWQTPVIIKPINGSSSIGIQRFTNAAQLEKALPLLSRDFDYIVQELIHGVEYTVNCFFDTEGCLKCTVPHRRIATRQGEVYKGITERLPILIDAAKKLQNLPFKFTGVVCFQAIVHEGKANVFEINARFGGGYPLAHKSGALFTQWLLEEISGIIPSYNDDWKEHVTMLRYDQSLFMDEKGDAI